MTMRLLAGYELLGRLASTDRTEVYLARRTSVGFEKIVVVKIVCDTDLRAQARVVGRAARLLGRFDHPHVVPVLDFGRCETGLYIVLEHIDGETVAALRECLRTHDEPLAPAAVAYLGAAIARALHYCREQADEAEGLGWVRWRASLDNILVGYDGTVKLIGFTPSEEPPEPGRDSLRVAAVLWELVTGRRVTGGRDSDLDWSLVTRDLADARESGPYQPSSVEDLCASCAPNEGEPPTLLELARRLEGIAREPAGASDAPIFDESELRRLMARIFSSERARRRQLVDLATSARASVGGLVLDRIGPREAVRSRARAPIEPPAETRVLSTKLTLAVLGAVVVVALIAPRQQEEGALFPRSHRPPDSAAPALAAPAARAAPVPVCVSAPTPVIVVAAEQAIRSPAEESRSSPSTPPAARLWRPREPAASALTAPDTLTAPDARTAPNGQAQKSTPTPPPLPTYTRARGSGVGP